MTPPVGIASRLSSLVARLAAAATDAPGIYAGIGILLVALFTVTTVIVSRFEHARAEHARSLFAEGQKSVAAHRVDDGIVTLRAALALDRRNPEYGLALASALLEAGRSHEASSYLDAVLGDQPTSGPANLVRARAARMLGDIDAAVVHYRRAADGTWPLARRGERDDVRFEVSEFLLGRSRLAEAAIVLAELRASAPDDAATRLRLARLLLLAKLADEAAAELRAVNRADPGEEVWALLARAEFALGNDAAARTWGQRVLKTHPEDEGMATLVEIAAGTLSRDPTQPRLRNNERIRRARQLLVDVLDASSACVIGRELMPEPLERARSEGREFLQTRSAADSDPAVDAVQLAEGLWTATMAACSDTQGRFPVLDRLLARLMAARPEGV